MRTRSLRTRSLRTRSLLAALATGAAAVAVLAAVGTPLAAQPILRPAPRLGIMAGANFATLEGDDAEGLDTRTGLVVGGVLTFPLTSAIAFQPEVLYSQKGATASEEGVDVTVKLDYVEVPLLLRFDVPTTGSTIRPHLYVGPSLAFKASCDIEASGGGVTASRSCRSLADEFEGDDLKDFDVGLTVGGALGFDLGARGPRLNVGARYTFGLADIAPEVESASLKNRTAVVYGSLDFPLGGR